MLQQQSACQCFGRSNEHPSETEELLHTSIKAWRRMKGDKGRSIFPRGGLTSGRWWCLRLNSEVSCKTFFLKVAKMSACRYISNFKG